MTAATPTDIPQVTTSGSDLWGAVLSVALSAFALVVCEYLPVGILPAIASGLGVSEGRAGLMMTVPALVAAVAAPALTLAAGSRDRRPVLWSFVGALLLSSLVSALTPSFGVLLLGRALLGVGIGGFWTIAPSLGSRLTRAESGARATSIIFAGISTATVLGVPAGKLIGDALGWRASFVAAAALAAVALLAQVRLLPELRTSRRVQAREILGLFVNPASRLGLLTATFVFVGQFAAYTYIAPFLKTVSGFGTSAVSILLLVYGGCGIAGTFLAGAWVGRRLRETLLGVMLLLAVSVAALPFVAVLKVASVGLIVLWGFASSGVIIALQTWMTRSAPELQEGGSALFVTSIQISIAAGAFAGGLVVDRFGNVGPMIFGGSLLLLATAVFGLLAPRHSAMLHQKTNP